jgi:hypothetical protein
MQQPAVNFKQIVEEWQHDLFTSFSSGHAAGQKERKKERKKEVTARLMHHDEGGKRKM